MGNRRWTDEELAFLKEHWGSIDMNKLEKRLDRTSNAIRRKASRLRLGNFLENGDYITLHYLYSILGLSIGGDGSRLKYWVNKRHLPVKTIQFGNKDIRIINIDDFWKWLENNQEMVDLSKLEPLILGKEPNWVKKKRKQDLKKNQRFKKGRYTEAEEEYLRYLLSLHKFTYEELSVLMKRPLYGLIYHIKQLKIPDRPVSREGNCTWTEKEYNQLCDLILQNCTYPELETALNKTYASICSKLFRTFGTKSLTKIKSRLIKTACK